MVVADDTTVVFAERLTPSPAAWLLAPGIGTAFFVMFFPVGTTTALLVAVVVALLGAAGLWGLATKVQLTTSHLTVGRARIEIAALGRASACTPQEFSRRMGPGSDARSYVLTRPWVRGGVHVEQTDPRDPTPYWLFSSRRPEEFVHALSAISGGDPTPLG